MHDHQAPLYGPDYNGEDRYLGRLRDLPVKLHRTREAFAAQFRATFQRHDITDQQFRVLRILSHADMLETGQLARLSMLLGPSISRILKDLIGRGLVTRHNTSADGRVFHHRITPKARRLIDGVLLEFDPFYEALARRFDNAAAVELNGALDRLLQALREMEGADGNGD